MNDLVTRFAQLSDLHQSPMYALLMQEIGWQVEHRGDSQLFYRSLGPLAVAKIQRPKSIDLDWIRSFRKHHHTLTTYIEPGLTTPSTLTIPGIPVEPFAHSCTSLIDLTGSEQTILNTFSQKTRYNITHNLKKNEIQVTSTSLGRLTTTQKDDFFSLHHDWSQKKHVVGHPLSLLEAVISSYAKSGDLHLCYHDSNLIGSLLILYHDSIATYYAACSRPRGYKSFAPTLLTWTAIQLAKERGCDIFDFGGIYDPRYPKLYKNWQGFTKFKSGFRPTVVSYPATTLQLGW